MIRRCGCPTQTIYQSIYVQSRGGLKRELAKHLRTGRALRKPHRVQAERRGRIPGMVNISQLPAAGRGGRAVPGHWRRPDLGSAGRSAPHSGRADHRFVRLPHLPHETPLPAGREAGRNPPLVEEVALRPARDPSAHRLEVRSRPRTHRGRGGRSATMRPLCPPLGSAGWVPCLRGTWWFAAAGGDAHCPRGPARASGAAGGARCGCGRGVMTTFRPHLDCHAWSVHRQVPIFRCVGSSILNRCHGSRDPPLFDLTAPAAEAGEHTVSRPRSCWPRSATIGPWSPSARSTPCGRSRSGPANTSSTTRQPRRRWSSGVWTPVSLLPDPVHR